MKVTRFKPDPFGGLRGLRHSADAFLQREVGAGVDILQRPVGAA